MHSVSRAELRADPLMGLMRDTMLGDDYVNPVTLRSHQLARIDDSLQTMKDQGILHEYIQIDKPLARRALASYLESLYSPHYEGFARARSGRHGRDDTDINFAVLHHFMTREGFTPEASARFRAPSTLEDITAKEEAMLGGEAFASQVWGKCSALPRAELMAQQREPHHRYLGSVNRSEFANARMGPALYSWPMG
jgi:hypothetical protein